MTDLSNTGYNGGPRRVCGESLFEDGRDGFFYYTGCIVQATRDGIYSGVFDKYGNYSETHEWKVPTALPPPGWACSKCNGSTFMDRKDGYLYCTDCHTKIPNVIYDSFPEKAGYLKLTCPKEPSHVLSLFGREEEWEKEWEECPTCDGSMFVDGQVCPSCLIQDIRDTTVG